VLTGCEQKNELDAATQSRDAWFQRVEPLLLLGDRRTIRREDPPRLYGLDELLKFLACPGMMRFLELLGRSCGIGR
jgi:hypothetical protein